MYYKALTPTVFIAVTVPNCLLNSWFAFSLIHPHIHSFLFIEPNMY